MNYLAHTFLSFTPNQMIGNIIGDFVKNNDKKKIPKEIWEGVILHREIDTYTDAHPVFQEAKKVFQPIVRLYSGAFLDVVFDYFLANDPTIKTSEEWKNFTSGVYKILFDNIEILPEKFQKILPRMQQDDWLFNYRFDWGIEYSIRNVLQKANLKENKNSIYSLFLKHKDYFRECFSIFFPDLQDFVIQIDYKLSNHN